MEIMRKTAVVFPGQASQYVGMGKDLYEDSEDVRHLYEMASDIIGEDIARLSFEGPEDRLKQTRFTQPAILLHSLAVMAVMKEDFPKPAITAGHSLGEYGALALAGVVSMEESIRSVVRRAALMEEACLWNEGTMAAIMGLEQEKIEEICEIASAEEIVVPANFNSSMQIVISGSIAGVEEACRLCREAGAKRAMVLPVGGAFHSPLMAPAGDGMREYLDSVAFDKPGIEMIPNVTANTEENPERLKALLVEQLTAPVRWHQTMQYLDNFGIDTFIEVGPGKVLSGLARREIKNAAIKNIDNLRDIEEFVSVTVDQARD